MLREKENVKGKKKKCLYGLEKRQVYLASMKAWQDYSLLNEQNDQKRMKHY
jgi:hypothetical protein